MRGSVKLRGRHYPVHQPPLQRGGGVDGVTGQRHLHGALASQRPSDRHHRRMTEEAALAAGRRERGVLGRDDQISARRQLGARSGRQRVYLGQHDLRDLSHRRHRIRTQREQPLQLGLAHRRHLCEVMARGEHRTVRGEHDSSHVRVRCGDPQSVLKLAEHLRRQAVAALGTIQRDRHILPARSVLLIQQVLIDHRPVLPVALALPILPTLPRCGFHGTARHSARAGRTCSAVSCTLLHASSMGIPPTSGCNTSAPLARASSTASAGVNTW